MALVGYPKTQKSIKIAIVVRTNGKGTHDVGTALAGSNTYFMVKNTGKTAGNKMTVTVKYVTGGTEYTYILFSGDTIDGPFVSVEVDEIPTSPTGSTFGAAMIYYQEI